MRLLFLTLCLLMLPMAAQAVEAPAGQTHIDTGKILRGHFTETRQVKGLDAPLQSTGHFAVAPGHGLIWGIEKPFPTSTIITPDGVAQDIGGMAVKLPAKNLRHIYEMVGGALAGDWSGLESDFTITRGGSADHWQMLLVPRPDKSKLSYTSIAVSGGRFVEHIAMMKGDSSSESMDFTDEVLSPAPLAAQEAMLFAEVKQ